MNRGEHGLLQDPARRRLPHRHLPARATTAATAPGRSRRPAAISPQPQQHRPAVPAGTRTRASSTAATGPCRRRGPCRPTPCPGIYIARLVERATTGGASHIAFVVRDDAQRSSNLLFQTSDTTWQAYNDYGGNSLYGGNGPGDDTVPGRAYKVSYNRPITTRAHVAPRTGCSTPSTRWCGGSRRTATTSRYFTGVDADRSGRGDRAAQGVPVGRPRRVLVTPSSATTSRPPATRRRPSTSRSSAATRCSGRPVWRQHRPANAYRTLVCYKETHSTAREPARPGQRVDGHLARRARVQPRRGRNPRTPSPGGIFTVNCCATAPGGAGRGRQDAVLAEHAQRGEPRSRRLGRPRRGTLGYEWDEDVDNGARPAGLVRLSTRTETGPGAHPRQRLDVRHRAPRPTTPSSTRPQRRARVRLGDRAVVVGARPVARPGSDPTSPDMQQATVNLFADMGVQPATLQADLRRRSPRRPTSTLPGSTITSPASAPLGLVTIQGTARPTCGGRVGAVEVSVDGGTTWHPAEGREAWSYSWTPAATGPVTVLRAGGGRQRQHRGARQPAVSVTVTEPAGAERRREHLERHRRAGGRERERQSGDAGRDRREVPVEPGRLHHRHALLQGRAGRRARTPATCGTRSTPVDARHRRVRRRDGLGLAGGPSLGHARGDRGEHDLRGLGAVLAAAATPTRTATSHQACHQPAADRRSRTTTDVAERGVQGRRRLPGRPASAATQLLGGRRSTRPPWP